MDEKGFLACNSAALQMFGYTNVAEMKHLSIFLPRLNLTAGPPKR